MTDDAKAETLDLAALAGIRPESLDLGPRPNAEALRFLLTRRSTPAKTLRAPGPTPAELALILKAAARIPDHGKLTPWRFLLIEGAAQAGLAETAATRAAATGRDADEIEKVRRIFNDGAMIVAVIASPKPSEKIPEFEQLLSAGAATAALVNAALACGYGANWLSGWLSHDPTFCAEALGLSAQERVAGFVHLGTPGAAPPERPRPEVDSLLSRLPAGD